jgi:hypothetical protein
MSPAVPMPESLGTNPYRVVDAVGLSLWRPATVSSEATSGLPAGIYATEDAVVEGPTTMDSPSDPVRSLGFSADEEVPPVDTVASASGETDADRTLYSQVGPLRVYHPEAYARFGRRTLEGVKGWAAEREGESRVRRLARMGGVAVRGSLKWVNLALGESMAAWVQAQAQGEGYPHVISWATFMAASLAIEVAFSAPSAVSNTINRRREALTETAQERGERLLDAATQGFFLGGAWGVQARKLNLKEMPIPIGAYLVYGGLLGIVTEFNHIAERLVSNPGAYAALGAIAAVKTFNSVSGFGGWTGRAAEWATKKVQAHRQSRELLQNEVSTVLRVGDDPDQPGVLPHAAPFHPAH